MKTFEGSELLELRLEMDLTQKEIADEIGISRETVSRIENEKHRPRMKTLRRIRLLQNVSRESNLSQNVTK